MLLAWHFDHVHAQRRRAAVPAGARRPTAGSGTADPPDPAGGAHGGAHGRAHGGVHGREAGDGTPTGLPTAWHRRSCSAGARRRCSVSGTRGESGKPGAPGWRGRRRARALRAGLWGVAPWAAGSVTVGSRRAAQLPKRRRRARRPTDRRLRTRARLRLRVRQLRAPTSPKRGRRGASRAGRWQRRRMPVRAGTAGTGARTRAPAPARQRAQAWTRPVRTQAGCRTGTWAPARW